MVQLELKRAPEEGDRIRRRTWWPPGCSACWDGPTRCRRDRWARETGVLVDGDTDIAAVAGLLADPIRVRFLLALSEDRALPAGELARLAHVSPSAASFHLSKLTDGGLLAAEAIGKRRYYRVASAHLVRAIEALALVCPVQPVTSLRQSHGAAAVRFARICDGHLAGQLGVALTDALVEQNTLIETGDDYTLTGPGRSHLAQLGVQAPSNDRYLATATRHPDWSQGGYHLAGPLATALADRLLDLGWLVPTRASRAVRLTPTGRCAFHRHFPRIATDQ